MFVLSWLASSLITPDPEFRRLYRVLEKHGFEVRLELPPKQGAYGLFEHNSQTIWINPVVFELGIAQPTLVHEAVHAAQSCAGKTGLTTLNLDLSPPQITKPFFFRYHNYRRELEGEAYTIQVQPNRTELAIELLERYCSDKGS
ncbi:MAG: hypothetical protein AB4368_29125 [Xenococcaceae cyanobacterium]